MASFSYNSDIDRYIKENVVTAQQLDDAGQGVPACEESPLATAVRNHLVILVSEVAVATPFNDRRNRSGRHEIHVEEYTNLEVGADMR